jgi:hypothetical protein
VRPVQLAIFGDVVLDSHGRFLYCKRLTCGNQVAILQFMHAHQPVLRYHGGSNFPYNLSLKKKKMIKRSRLTQTHKHHQRVSYPNDHGLRCSCVDASTSCKGHRAFVPPRPQSELTVAQAARLRRRAGASGVRSSLLWTQNGD